LSVRIEAHISIVPCWKSCKLQIARLGLDRLTLKS
jgi:hypothetical protein